MSHNYWKQERPVRATKKYPKEQVRQFHNILIFEAWGEWFDRYLENKPFDRNPDYFIWKSGRDGVYGVWRATDVSDENWQAALQSLQGDGE